MLPSLVCQTQTPILNYAQERKTQGSREERSPAQRHHRVQFDFDKISNQLEHKVPSVSSRIRAMEKIAGLGWPVGVRIDPLIDCKNFEDRYHTLFDKLFANLLLIPFIPSPLALFVSRFPTSRR